MSELSELQELVKDSDHFQQPIVGNVGIHGGFVTVLAHLVHMCYFYDLAKPWTRGRHPSNVQKCRNCRNCWHRRGIPTISNGQLSEMSEYTGFVIVLSHRSTSCVICMTWQTHGHGADTPSGVQNFRNCRISWNRRGLPTIPNDPFI